MKIKIQMLLGMLCFIPNIFMAQNGVVKGKISLSNQSPVSAVLVTLLQAKDNVLVKTQISESDGSYEFNKLPDDNYLVVIEDDQYKPFQSQVIVISKEKQLVALPIILTKNEANALNEVVIKKKKSFVENKLDKTVLNVDALISAAGGDAMEVLEKAPGIIVDETEPSISKARQVFPFLLMASLPIYRELI